MNDLQRFDNGGIELIINTQTGESFASISGYARMVNLSVDTIAKRVKRGSKGLDKSAVKTAEIQTAGGLQGVDLLSESVIAEWIVKDNPEIAAKLIQAGVRVYLHTLAGYTVSSTATKQEPLSVLDALIEGLKVTKQIQEELNRASLEIQQLNEFKQEMLDVRDNTLAEFKKLPEPSVAVAELKTKERLNRMIRDYAIANNIPFGTVYNKLYMEFRDRYHIDLKVRGNNQKPKLSGTEYADSINMIEQLYAVASEVFV